MNFFNFQNLILSKNFYPKNVSIILTSTNDFYTKEYRNNIKLYMNRKLLKFSVQCFWHQGFISTWYGRRVRQSLSRGKRRRKMPGKYLFKNITFFSTAFLPTDKSRKCITLYMDGKLFKFPFQRCTKLSSGLV